MRYLGSGELRLLRRLIIDPSLRQADLAKELGVSRSAVNQIWNELIYDHNLRVCANLDYGRIGLQMIFGWAITSGESDILLKFSRWLESSRFVTTLVKSTMSSTFDSRLYFEALLPVGNQASWFHSQVDRFRKKPYSLRIYTSPVSRVSYHMNLGLFDGSNWDFPSSFRLEASIGAAYGYVDILPTVGTVTQSIPIDEIPDTILTAAVLESDYFATATNLAKFQQELGLASGAGRTLRRRIHRVRKEITRPYVEIENIGLSKRLLVSFQDNSEIESPLSQVLHAQAGTFPKARVVSGPNLTLLELQIPGNIEWLELSQVLAKISGIASETCTFIADKSENETRLKNVVSHLISRTPSGLENAALKGIE